MLGAHQQDWTQCSPPQDFVWYHTFIWSLFFPLPTLLLGFSEKSPRLHYIPTNPFHDSFFLPQKPSLVHLDKEMEAVRTWMGICLKRGSQRLVFQVEESSSSQKHSPGERITHEMTRGLKTKSWIEITTLIKTLIIHNCNNIQNWLRLCVRCCTKSFNALSPSFSAYSIEGETIIFPILQMWKQRLYKAL